MSKATSTPRAESSGYVPPGSPGTPASPASASAASPSPSKKPLMTRAFRKVYKSVTAPEKDAEGKRIPISSSLSRRFRGSDRPSLAGGASTVRPCSPRTCRRSPLSGQLRAEHGKQDDKHVLRLGHWRLDPLESSCCLVLCTRRIALIR
jgi:hypothetical protein